MMQNTIVKKHPLLLNNPELTRNFWQELGIVRLILVPAIIALALILMRALIKDTEQYYLVLQITCSYLFLFGTVFWGMWLAHRSLSVELIEETWDTQRLSATSPISMLLGKLFGGTVMAWYVALFIIPIFLYASLNSVNSMSADLPYIRLVIYATLIALLAHTFALSTAAAKIQGGRKSRKANSVLVILFLCFFGFQILFAFFAMGAGFIAASMALSSSQLFWFGQSWQGVNLFLMTLLCLNAWALIMLWLQFRKNLHEGRNPFWWLACLLFWFIYLAGFIPPENTIVDTSVKALLPNTIFVWFFYILSFAFTVLALVYIQLLGERKDIVYWSHLSKSLKDRDSQRALNLYPNWLTSYLLALIFALGLLFAWLIQDNKLPAQEVSLLLLLSSLLFALRDLAFVHWIYWRPQQKRAAGSAILFLTLAYTLLPSLAGTLINREAAFLFMPIFPIEQMYNQHIPSALWLYLLSPAIQAGVILALLYQRGKERNKKLVAEYGEA